MSYPEHEKLKLVAEKSQCCGEFLDWLATKGLFLCKWDDKGEYAIPAHVNNTTLLAGFFKIDLKILEDENQQILTSIKERAP